MGNTSSSYKAPVSTAVPAKKKKTPWYEKINTYYKIK